MKQNIQKQKSIAYLLTLLMPFLLIFLLMPMESLLEIDKRESMGYDIPSYGIAFFCDLILISLFLFYRKSIKKYFNKLDEKETDSILFLCYLFNFIFYIFWCLVISFPLIVMGISFICWPLYIVFSILYVILWIILFLKTLINFWKILQDKKRKKNLIFY